MAEDDFAAWTVLRLKEELRGRGLKVSGTKTVLLQRLQEHSGGEVDDPTGGGDRKTTIAEVEKVAVEKIDNVTITTVEKVKVEKVEGTAGAKKSRSRKRKKEEQQLPPPSPELLEKAERIRRALLDLYPPPVPVPLDHSDAFTLLVAVVLSAQTTDGKVNAVTKELFQKAPNPQAMVELGKDEILRIIRPVGLAPGKSQRLHAMAQELIDRHDAQVPSSFEELEALSGVGHKTASVVMAQAFGVPCFPVDTHIHRLANRWGLSNSNKVEDTERDLKNVFAKEHWNDLHLRIIYFGREHCPAKGHIVELCPICSFAAASTIQSNPFKSFSSGASVEGDEVPTTPKKARRDTSSPTETPSSNYKKRKGIITYSERRAELEKMRVEEDR